jgi:hypothetical protein
MEPFKTQSSTLPTAIQTTENTHRKDHLAGETNVLPQPLVHQSSLHVVQLLLDHSLIQLHVQALQAFASRADQRSMAKSALMNRPMRRVRKRAAVSTDHLTPRRSTFVVDRSRRRIELIAITVNTMWARAGWASHGRQMECGGVPDASMPRLT